MIILYALLVLLVAVLVTTITSLYDLLQTGETNLDILRLPTSHSDQRRTSVSSELLDIKIYE